MCQLHLCWGVRHPPHEYLEYDIKLHMTMKALVLELWGMRTTPSLHLLPGSLLPGFVVPGRLPLMVLIIYYNWNNTTMHKQPIDITNKKITKINIYNERLIILNKFFNYYNFSTSSAGAAEYINGRYFSQFILLFTLYIYIHTYIRGAFNRFSDFFFFFWTRI